MKKTVLFIALLCFTKLFSQEALDTYKYVIIPYKFSFSDHENEYRLNTTLRHKLKEKGFNVYFDNQSFPEDLAMNRCLATFADLEEQNGLFRTSLSIVFRDCYNKEVYKTVYGSSKKKEYDQAYLESMMNTLKDLDEYTYNYNGSGGVAAPQKVEVVEEVKEEVIVEEKVPVVTDKVASKTYDYKGRTYKIEINKSESSVWSYIVENGSKSGIINSSSKANVFHVFFEDKWGLGYFDKFGNFMIEVSDKEGNMNIKKLNLN